MALETLERARDEALGLLGIDAVELEPLQQQDIRFLGHIALGEKQFSAYRGFTGPDGLIGKGGIRFEEFDAEDDAIARVSELSAEMDSKLALRGYTDLFRGAKGLVNVDARALDPAEKEEVARQYGELLEANGLLGYDVDVAAGDVGTNGLSDIIARGHAERHPEDPYAAAVITGKSPENGGLPSRAGATGLGGIATQHKIMEARGETKVTSTLQGFGNVGAWYGYYADSDPQQRVAVVAIGEREGVLRTPDPRGLPITLEMVHAIGDNPKWNGPKLTALRDMMQAHSPDLPIYLDFVEDGADILSVEADYFVPAAMNDVITERTVDRLGAKVGVIELANGPTTAAAHAALVARGIIVAPDILANSGGVDMSINEWQANLDLANGIITEMPDEEALNDALRDSTQALTEEVLEMADRLETPDLRVAAVALGIQRLMQRQNRLARFSAQTHPAELVSAGTL